MAIRGRTACFHHTCTPPVRIKHVRCRFRERKCERPMRPPERPLYSIAMNVSAAVMTHPTRLVAARRLCAALAPIDATPAVDPEPHATPGAMRSARLAWAAGDP